MKVAVDPTSGRYRVHRADGRRAGMAHLTFADAETEACRLADLNPGTAFVVAADVTTIVKGNPHD